MKTRTIIFILMMAVMAVPEFSMAAQLRQGFYASAFTGITVASDADVSSISGGSNFNDRAEFDPGINAGGTFGYDFGMGRLEGELSYKHSEIKTVTDRQTGYRYRSVDGSLGAFAVMFNGFVDLRNDSRVTPYLGGGIGFASLHLSDTSGIASNGVRTILYDKADATVFAYQLGAGMEIALNRRLSLDVGYRYFATERADFDSDWNSSASMKLETHNGTVGVRFKF